MIFWGAFAGFLAAVLSATFSLLGQAQAEAGQLPFLFLLAPATFGMAMAFYLRSFLPRWTLGKAIGLTIAALYSFGSAGLVLVFSSIPDMFNPNHMQVSQTRAPVIFLAGMAGSFLFLLTLLPLFTADHGVAKKALRWSFAGGAFAAVGHLMAPIIQHGVPAWAADSGWLAMIYICWETGMGAVVGLIFRSKSRK